jgi:hypothetical protein
METRYINLLRGQGTNGIGRHPQTALREDEAIPGHDVWYPVFDCGKCERECRLDEANLLANGVLVCAACCDEDEQYVWCPECRQPIKATDYCRDADAHQRLPDSCDTCRNALVSYTAHYEGHCEWCGKFFVARRPTARFCSHYCRATAGNVRRDGRTTAPPSRGTVP